MLAESCCPDTKESGMTCAQNFFCFVVKMGLHLHENVTDVYSHCKSKYTLLLYVNLIDTAALSQIIPISPIYVCNRSRKDKGGGSTDIL